MKKHQISLSFIPHNINSWIYPAPKHGAGFTFVELLLYMGILALLLLVQTQIFTSVLGVRLESEANSEVAQDARYIMARLIYDINRAENITQPATPSDQTDSLGLIINGELHTYSQSGENLLLTNNLETNNLNSYGSRISNLSFKRLGNQNGKNTVTVLLTLTSLTRKDSGYETRNIKFSSGLR